MRYSAGVSELDIKIPAGLTIYELLRFVAGKYGREFKGELFLDNGDNLRDVDCGLRDDLTIVVNGIIIEHSKALTHKIEGDALVTLLPVFPGGG